MQSILLQTEFIAFIRLLPQLYRAPDWLREVYLALWLANVWHILHSDSSLLSWNWRCQWDLLLQPKVKTVASVAAWQEMRNCVQISTPDSLLVTGTQQGPLIGQDQCWDLSDVSWVRLSTPVQYWPLARGHRTQGHLRGQLPTSATGPQPLPLQPIVWGFYWQISFPCRAMWIQRNVPWWKNCNALYTALHCWVSGSLFTIALITHYRIRISTWQFLPCGALLSATVSIVWFL